MDRRYFVYKLFYEAFLGTVSSSKDKAWSVCMEKRSCSKWTQVLKLPWFPRKCMTRLRRQSWKSPIQSSPPTTWSTRTVLRKTGAQRTFTLRGHFCGSRPTQQPTGAESNHRSPSHPEDTSRISRYPGQIPKGLHWTRNPWRGLHHQIKERHMFICTLQYPSLYGIKSKMSSVGWKPWEWSQRWKIPLPGVQAW